MVVIRILRWNPDQSWTDWSGRQRTALARRLGGLMGLRGAELKRLTRRILGRECNEIALTTASDRFAAEPVRQILEALGAEVAVEDA